MTTILSQCAVCRRLNSANYTCKAFPNGIPDNVALNQVDHRKPVDGDNGVRWSPVATDTEHPLGPIPKS